MDALWLRVPKQALRGAHTASIASYQHRAFHVKLTAGFDL